MKLFLDEANYIPSIDGYIAIKELYREYRRFCQDNGYHAVSSINFKRRLVNAKIMTNKKISEMWILLRKITDIAKQRRESDESDQNDAVKKIYFMGNFHVRKIQRC